MLCFDDGLELRGEKLMAHTVFVSYNMHNDSIKLHARKYTKLKEGYRLIAASSPMSQYEAWLMKRRLESWLDAYRTLGSRYYITGEICDTLCLLVWGETQFDFVL